MNFWFWLPLIFLYYFLATILPIDKLIGRIYPLFGALLLIMAVGVTVMLFVKDSGSFYHWAEWTNQHPQGLPLWPGDVHHHRLRSPVGFHATQSPLMARCMGNEKQGRSVFYGAMIAEGFIACVGHGGHDLLPRPRRPEHRHRRGHRQPGGV